MDEKIKTTIQKIKLLALQNPEFAQEMQKMFGGTTSASVGSMSNKVTDEIIVIREALEIRANKSVSYDFVKEQRLRDQLTIDNLRMENASLNLQQPETERFYTFCVNAFYQLENLVNYYFYITFPKIEDLLSTIEKYTEQEGENFKFTRSGKEKNVGDISVVNKINALCNIFFPKDNIKIALSQLRQVRNEGEHRCMVILQEKNEKNSLYKFFKYNTFNSVRIYLIKVVNAIKNNVGKPIMPTLSTTEATITQMLPSACFIEYEGNKNRLDERFFPKVKGKQVGEKILVHLVNGNIVNIE